MNLGALLGLAIVVFASTNIDDIFVLLGFLANPLYHLGRSRQADGEKLLLSMLGPGGMGAYGRI
jgi:hypothetical protein